MKTFSPKSQYQHQLAQLIKVLTGRHKEYYEWLIGRAIVNELTNMESIFTKEELDIFKKYKIEKKACFQNAYKLVTHNPKRITYIEGILMYGGVQIEHAWCKIDDKYFDPTAYYCFGKTTLGDEYNEIIELNDMDLYKFSALTGVYGPYIVEYYQEII